MNDLFRITATAVVAGVIIEFVGIVLAISGNEHRRVHGIMVGGGLIVAICGLAVMAVVSIWGCRA